MALIVELVGRGGVGKSSIAAAMHAIPDVRVLRGPDNVTPKTRVRAARSASAMAAKYRLGPRQSLSLARKCASVEAGFAAWAAARTAGFAVVDEGPIRTLRDTRCSSQREREAWRAYAKRMLARLCDRRSRILIVHVHLEESVRAKRYRTRISRTEEIERHENSRVAMYHRGLDRLSGRQGAINVPTVAMEVDRLVLQQPGKNVTSIGTRVLSSESPTVVAYRLFRLMTSIS